MSEMVKIRTTAKRVTVESLSFPLAPKILECTDVDEFRSWVRNVDLDFTPLVREIAAAAGGRVFDGRLFSRRK